MRLSIASRRARTFSSVGAPLLGERLTDIRDVRGEAVANLLMCGGELQTLFSQ